ncbi:superoxide dismutase [Clostridium sp.]|uniref:superoxide dismutase n=1 Tax=Clostridium sp. TaxID=1506 RepID=UPI001A5BF835|nr:superoxide dismutase [Clostridium sp.]MBK5242927.1 superoxide dismutase [Clostridium sp.]
MYDLKPETFDFKSVNGISIKQLNDHYKLYLGYVSKLNEIYNTHYIPTDYIDSNSIMSRMRSLKLGETYSLNGVKLHDLYFENIVEGNNIPYGPLLNAIINQFSSYDNFISYLTNVGLSMRGWVVLTIDLIDNKLHIIGSDSHDIGAVWLSCPILIMDVYEHAYFMDFGTDRRKYISTFIENINWKVLNHRFQECVSSIQFLDMKQHRYYPYNF